jgi:hypothetical protein
MIKKKVLRFKLMLRGEWLVQMLLKITVSNTKTYNFQEIKSDFETNLDDFELFWYSKPIHTLRGFDY